MTQAISLQNHHQDEELHNPLLKVLHPLSMKKIEAGGTILTIPSWIGTPRNKIELKEITLELLKPE